MDNEREVGGPKCPLKAGSEGTGDVQGYVHHIWHWERQPSSQYSGAKRQHCCFGSMVDDALRKVGKVSPSNEYLFPNTHNSSYHIIGWDATNNVLGKANINCPLINATNQRGRLSTMYAGLELDPTDRELFYKHMGRKDYVNINTYQRPLPLIAVTKVGSNLKQIDKETGHENLRVSYILILIKQVT